MTTHIFTYDQKEELLLFFNNRCAYCGKDIEGSMEWEHINPITNGGLTIASNMVPSCLECNDIKYNFVFESFEEAQEYIWSKKMAARYKNIDWDEVEAKTVRYQPPDLDSKCREIQEYLLTCLFHEATPKEISEAVGMLDPNGNASSFIGHRMRKMMDNNLVTKHQKSGVTKYRLVTNGRYS